MWGVNTRVKQAAIGTVVLAVIAAAALVFLSPRMRTVLRSVVGGARPTAAVTPAGSGVKTAATGGAATKAGAAPASKTAPPNPSTPPSGPAPRSRSAFQRLAASDPSVRWVTDSAIVADVDCDQALDTVVVGRSRTEVHLGLARAADAIPQILVFDVGSGKGALPTARPKLGIESLDVEPADRGLGKLEGFSRSSTCKGITLGESGKRQIHVLWSNATRHIEWFQR